MREVPAQVGVLDIGCHSAHLVVLDRDQGSPLDPVLSRKIRLQIDRHTTSDGAISAEGIDRVCAAVTAAQRKVAHKDSVVAFATSSIRDAANAEQVIRRVSRRTGVELQTFTGQQEAHLSYIAARHWFGHCAGPLTVFDVGGGTAEVAAGFGTQPTATYSLPYGARSLTRTGLSVAEMRDEVRAAIPGMDLSGMAVGCSKVLQQLARLTGARPQREGPFVPRHLHVADLREWIPRLAELRTAQRAELPGISRHRARQSLAGAVVAEVLLTETGYDTVQICPWSTKEGLLIRLLEHPGLPLNRAELAA
jgi:exopolyphosphatase / guanosine-5'-triphosphate,3'-diphosphate pyrophosphatase